MASVPKVPVEQPAPTITPPKQEPLPSSSSLDQDVSLDKDSVEEWKPSSRLYVAFLTLCVITLMVALDGTSLSVALPIIAQDLRGTAIEAFWSGTSFLLTSTIFQPSFASFSHIFGRRPTIMVALVFFLLGAIVASVSNSFGSLLVGRSLQGIGGGGLIALTEIVVTDLVPLRLRGQWFGFISAMWSIGSVTGPIVGGAFSQNVTWRWIFYINFPFVAVAFVFVPLFLKLNFVPQKLRDQLKRVDYIGTVLFIGSTTSFLIPITWGGIMYAWDSWRTLVPLIIGSVGLITFVIWEEYGAKEPLIRTVIFKNRTTAASFFMTVIHGMILWCNLYYLPLYYEAVKGYTPIISGIALFPETFTVAPAAAITGILISKTGHYRWAIWSGWILAVVGDGLLYLLDVDTSITAWIFINLVSGLGLGLLFPSMAFSIQASTSNKDLAFAVAMYSFFRAFGQAVGVAIGGTIFQNTMKIKLMAYPLLAGRASEYAQDAAALVQTIKVMDEGLMKTQLIQGYADTLKVVFITTCGLASLGLLSSLLVRGLDLNRALETEQGFLDEPKKHDPEKN